MNASSGINACAVWVLLSNCIVMWVFFRPGGSIVDPAILADKKKAFEYYCKKFADTKSIDAQKNELKERFVRTGKLSLPMLSRVLALVKIALTWCSALSWSYRNGICKTKGMARQRKLARW